MFIQLTRPSGRKVTLNVNHIVEVWGEERAEIYTSINGPESSGFTVIESHGQVARLLGPVKIVGEDLE